MTFDVSGGEHQVNTKVAPSDGASASVIKRLALNNF